jgi:hypothetical protein
VCTYTVKNRYSFLSENYFEKKLISWNFFYVIKTNLCSSEYELIAVVDKEEAAINMFEHRYACICLKL